MKTERAYIPVVTCIAMSMILVCSCAGDSHYVVRGCSGINDTDTVGIESIAERIDTVRIQTDSLYDISLFGVSEDRYYGLTADRVIVVLDHSGRVLHSSRRIGRGPGEFVDIGTIRYDPYNDEILLLDLFNKVIFLYPDCRLKEEIKNGETPSVGDILPVGPDRYVSPGMSFKDREQSITVYDREFRRIGGMMPLMNVAQRVNRGLLTVETLREFNSRVMYKPYGENTYYELSDTSYRPYLTVDFGRYAEPEDLVATVGDSPQKARYFQVEYDYICGKYYMVMYIHQQGECCYYDIFDMTTGLRVSHYRYGYAEYGGGIDEGFIFRYGGRRYGIFPQYVQDNVLYWSRFDEDGTTLFRIQLKS